MYSHQSKVGYVECGDCQNTVEIPPRGTPVFRPGRACATTVRRDTNCLEVGTTVIFSTILHDAGWRLMSITVSGSTGLLGPSEVLPLKPVRDLTCQADILRHCDINASVCSHSGAVAVLTGIKAGSGIHRDLLVGMKRTRAGGPQNCRPGSEILQRENNQLPVW